jgi:hypothetical protein
MVKVDGKGLELVVERLKNIHKNSRNEGKKVAKMIL